MIFQALYAQAFTSLAQVLTPNGEEKNYAFICKYVYLQFGSVNYQFGYSDSCTADMGMTDFKTLSCVFPHIFCNRVCF